MTALDILLQPINCERSPSQNHRKDDKGTDHPNPEILHNILQHHHRNEMSIGVGC